MADKKLIQHEYDKFVSPVAGNNNNSAVRSIIANAASPTVGQAKMTGGAVQLTAGALLNGVIITAKSTNAAPVELGLSGVTTTNDGTGNGYILEAGTSISFAVTDVSTIYAIGTSGDVISWAGS